MARKRARAKKWQAPLAGRPLSHTRGIKIYKADIGLQVMDADASDYTDSSIQNRDQTIKDFQNEVGALQKLEDLETPNVNRISDSFLPPHVAIILLAFDVVINIVLAVHYCVLAWRVSPLESIQEVADISAQRLEMRGYITTALSLQKRQDKLRAKQLSLVECLIDCQESCEENCHLALPFRKLQAASNDHQKIRKFQIG